MHLQSTKKYSYIHVPNNLAYKENKYFHRQIYNFTVQKNSIH